MNKITKYLPVALIASASAAYAQTSPEDQIDTLAGRADTLFGVVVGIGLAILGYKVMRKVLNKL